MNTDSREPKAYIFLNGTFEKPARQWADRPGEADLVIAADGGAEHALSLGWPVHCLIGDLDSIDRALVEKLESAGSEVIRYPTAKDEIDFELALVLARKRGYAEVEVLAALGGRWDMSFGNLFLPRAGGWGSERIRFRQGPWTFWNISGPASLLISGKKGDRLSLLPLGEDVRGVSLSGCRYPLAEETLRAGLTRGLSNELEQPECSLDFSSGYLLVMHQAF